jgi:hypothetical protein
MAEPFLGEIRMFGGNFAPSGWQGVWLQCPIVATANKQTKRLRFVGHIKEGFIPTIQPNWLDNRERFCLLFLRTRRMNVTTAKDWSTAHKEGYGLFLRSHHSRM